VPVPKNFNFGDQDQEFIKKLKDDPKKLTKFTPEQISTLKEDQVAQVITEKSIKYLSKDALKALGPKINAIKIEALKQIDDEVILQNLNADKKKELIATNPEKYLKLFKTADLNKGDAFAITDTTDVATIKSFLERSTRPLTHIEVSYILLKDNDFDEVVWNILADPKRVPDSVLVKINFVACKKDKVTKFVQQLGVRVFKLNVVLGTINILFNLIRNGIRLSEEQYRLFPQDVLNALMDHLYEDGRITVKLLNPPNVGGNGIYIGGADDKIVIASYMANREIPIQFFVDLKSSINKIKKENLVKLTKQLLEETKNSTKEIYSYNLTPILSNISDKDIISIIAKDDRYKSKLTDNQTFIVNISKKNEETKAEILQSIQSIGKMIIPSILLYNLIHVTKHVPVEATNHTTYKLHEVLQKVLTSLLVAQKVQQVQQINKKQENNLDMSHKVFDTLNHVSILTTVISKLIAHIQSPSHSNNTSTQGIQPISYDAPMIDSIRNSLLSTLTTSKLQNMVSTSSTSLTRNVPNNAPPTASVQPIDKTIIDNIFEVILANKIMQLTEPSNDAVQNAVRAVTAPNTHAPDINSDIVNSIITTIVSNNAILNLHQSDQLPNAQPPEVQEQNHINNNSEMTSQLAQVVKTIVIMYHIIHSVSDKSKEETRMIFSKLNDFMPIIANALTTLYNKTVQRVYVGGAPPIPIKKPSIDAPKDKREEKTLANKEEIDYDKILTDLENWDEKLKSIDDIKTKLTDVNTNYIETYNSIKAPTELDAKITQFSAIVVPDSARESLNTFGNAVTDTLLDGKLKEISEKIAKFEDTISSKYIETLLNKVGEYKKIHTDIKSYVESKKHFIPLLTSDELQDLKEKLREYLKNIESFINNINEIKNNINETEIKAIKTLIKSISDKLTDYKNFSNNKSNLTELKSKLNKLETSHTTIKDKVSTINTNFDTNIKKPTDDINTILKKVYEIAKKKSRNPMQKAVDGNSLDDKLTTESAYNSIWNNYLDDLKDNSKLLEKTQDKFYKAFRNKNLDPEDALKLSSDDKILFCIIIFIIRQIALAITELMIDNGYVNILHNALIAYGAFYTLIILIIIIVINFDDYKLRIMFNYFNMHINPSGVIGHIFMVIGLMVLMYFIIYNIDKNVKNQKAAITEIEKMRLIYKLELMTIFIFVLVSAITIVS
jgi:hypothetical protein